MSEFPYNLDLYQFTDAELLMLFKIVKARVDGQMKHFGRLLPSTKIELELYQQEFKKRGISI